MFQSKDPSGFIGYPVWDIGKIKLCTALETNRVYPEIMKNAPDPIKRCLDFGSIPLEDKFITVEPIMDFDLKSLVEMIHFCRPQQVNIGADSMGKKLPEPPAEKVRDLIEALSEFTDIKEKKNLNRLINIQ